MDAIDLNTLPATLRDWINKRLRTGFYTSPEDVLQRAMEALEFIEFSEKLQAGIDQINLGEGRIIERAALDQLKARIHEQGLKRLRRRTEST